MVRVWHKNYYIRVYVYTRKSLQSNKKFFLR